MTVQAISNSSLIGGNIVPGTKFTVDWGDGSPIETYVAKHDSIIGGVCTNRLDPPPGYFIHKYPDQSVGSWKDSCLYLPMLTIKNNCGTDQLTGIVNGWNKENCNKIWLCQSLLITLRFSVDKI